MGITAGTPDQGNRVVVAYVDGRRVKGHTYNFSAMKDVLTVFSKDNNEKIETPMRELKAIFFVKDFEGTPNKPDEEADRMPQGRPIEVTFKDGEKLKGATNGYNPQKLGFFMLPALANSNNLRIFVVSSNTAAVKLG
jgi:small nuclear ribonucleoprotein (snRNP)-like protein